MATRIDPDGTITEITPADGKAFTLPELQAIVGGYIEAIYTSPGGRIMYINEDGKGQHLPVNLKATRRVRGLRVGDVIVGSVVLCTLKETGDA